MANVAELQGLMDRIMEDLGHWNQGSWAYLPDRVPDEEYSDSGHGLIVMKPDCGAAYCAAGNVVSHHGWGFVAYPGSRVMERIVPLADPTSTSQNPAEVAARILEISDKEGDTLFAGINSLVTLWTYAYLLAGGELNVPPSLPAHMEDSETVEAEPNLAAVMLQTIRNDWDYSLVLDNVTIDMEEKLEQIAAARARQLNLDTAHENAIDYLYQAARAVRATATMNKAMGL